MLLCSPPRARDCLNNQLSVPCCIAQRCGAAAWRKPGWECPGAEQGSLLGSAQSLRPPLRQAVAAACWLYQVPASSLLELIPGGFGFMQRGGLFWVVPCTKRPRRGRRHQNPAHKRGTEGLGQSRSIQPRSCLPGLQRNPLFMRGKPRVMAHSWQRARMQRVLLSLRVSYSVPRSLPPAAVSKGKLFRGCFEQGHVKNSQVFLWFGRTQARPPAV